MNSHEKIIRLFDADTLDYASMIVVKDTGWEYCEVDNEYLRRVTSGMPINGVLASLISFNLVYEIESMDVE